jgi:hypothetical protein
MVKTNHLGNYRFDSFIYTLGRSPFLDGGLKAGSVREGECNPLSRSLSKLLVKIYSVKNGHAV